MFNYSENCDYLRERFTLPVSVGLHELINIVSNHLKEQDLKTTILKQENISKEKEQCPKKPKISLQSKSQKKSVTKKKQVPKV